MSVCLRFINEDEYTMKMNDPRHTQTFTAMHKSTFIWLIVLLFRNIVNIFCIK